MVPCGAPCDTAAFMKIYNRYKQSTFFIIASERITILAIRPQMSCKKTYHVPLTDNRTFYFLILTIVTATVM